MSYHKFVDDGGNPYCIVTCDDCGKIDHRRDYIYQYKNDGWVLTAIDGWSGDAVCPTCATPENIVITKNNILINGVYNSERTLIYSTGK